MSPRTTRNAGRAVFAIPLLLILGPYAVLQLLDSTVSGDMSAEGIDDALLPVRLAGWLLVLTIYGLLALVFWASNGLFRSQGFRGANIPTALVIIGLLISGALQMLSDPSVNVSLLSISVSLVVTELTIFFITSLGGLVIIVPLSWFAICCVQVKRAGGDGIWAVIGWLYALAVLCFLSASVYVAGGGDLSSEAIGVLIGWRGLEILVLVFLVGLLAAIAAWFCHGTALLKGAAAADQAAAASRS